MLPILTEPPRHLKSHPGAMCNVGNHDHTWHLGAYPDIDLTGAICVRIYFAFMVMVGVCSTSPILVKNNPKFGVPKLIRLKVICN